MTKEERLLKEKERLAHMYDEQRIISAPAKFVFGIDEAGRGPLCGPVVAACCILKDNEEILYLNDSKKLSEKRRDELFDIIRDRALAYGIGIINEKTVDKINILNAALYAMKLSFDECFAMYRKKCSEALSRQEAELTEIFDSIPAMSDSVVLVDGNKEIPDFLFRQKTVVGGDAKCPCISAASVLAKVTRDRMMKEYDIKYPGYGFAKNKGYGTREHIEALKKFGPTEIHRRTFLKNIL